MSGSSKPAVLDPSDARPRPRIKRRPVDVTYLNNVDILHEPLFPQRRSGRLRTMAGAEILLEQEYVRAFEGSVADIESIFWKDRANREARIMQRRYDPPPKNPKKDAAKARFSANLREVTEAMLLLRAAVIDFAAHRKAMSVKYPEETWPILLCDWVVEGALARSPGKIRGGYEEMYLAAGRSDIGVDGDPLREDALAALRLAGQPGHSRFRKGVSGNPQGRPRKSLIRLPFPFLEEVIVLTVANKRREVTRMEGLLFHLQTKAIKGDRRLSHVLARILKQHHRSEWHPPLYIFEPGTNQPRGESPLVCDNGRSRAFPAMRLLGVCSARAKKTVRLEPWFVKLALDRLVPGSLDIKDQEVVFAACCRPHLVRWPDWWECTGQPKTD